MRHAHVRVFAWPCRVQTDFRVISRVISVLDLAEREGFDLSHFLQVAVILRHSDNSLCLCGVQADFQLRAGCLRRLPTTCIDRENGIIGISLGGENANG